jgi:TonB-linked SusC/RagA family outer membrane protein
MPKKKCRLLPWSWLAFLLACSSAVSAQQTVTGTIISSNDRQPVAGATIQVRGTETYAQSGNDGAFSIRVPAGSSVLLISVVGYERMAVPVSGRSSLGEIPLQVLNAALNQVVVTGYTAQRKKDITGSVAVVNVQDMKAIPSGTAESLLQGQAAGVTVINTGQPGGVSNVRIRGITSTGNTDPLVIIDGTPGSLHDLNVNDIQSVQVLKDAGAAAIYGVRGSNGVIVVTTKRGRSGKAQIAYDGYVGTQRPLSKGYNLANPTETANAIWKEYSNDGLAPTHKQYGSGPTPVIPDYITPAGAMEGDPGTDPSTYALYTNQITKANKAGTDWFHEIFKPALIQSHNVSLTGGGEKSVYYFSFNYFDQQGTLINTYLKRYSARVNTRFSLIDDKLRVGENLYVFYKQNPGYLNLPGVNNANAIGASSREPGIIPVYDIKGNFAGTGSQDLGNSPQPVAIQARQAHNSRNDWQMNGNVYAELTVAKHLTARSSIGGTIDNYYFNSFVYTAYENAENSQNPNSYIENYGWNSSYTWTNTLNYTNTFSEKHQLSLLIGSEYINNNSRSVTASRGSYYITDPSNLTVDPNLWTLNFGSPGSQANGNGPTNIPGNSQQTPYQLAIFSLFGRLDYSFNEKYYLSGTLRRDGSSVFDPAKRYGYFPSVTAGWRISGESFLKDVTWLNDLKIRGGWGKLGSINNISPTNAFTLFQSLANQSYYDINGTSNNPTQGIITSQYGNKNTTWEEDIITNIGFDATFLQNRFDLTAEWYRKSISGLIYLTPAPGTIGGAAAPFSNAGNISNQGVDIALTYHGSAGRDFKYDITGTFTTYNNKVVSLPAGIQYYDFPTGSATPNGRLAPGHPVGAFYGYKVIGLFQDASDVSKSPTQDGAAPGRFKYQDVNQDGKIDNNDRTYVGNPNPKFSAGLNIGIAWRDFDFSTFLYASVGSNILNSVRSSTDFPQQFNNAMSKTVALHSATLVNEAGQPTNILDPTARVADPKSTVPLLERNANFSNATVFNSYLIEKGSYLRCRSMILGYTMPAGMLSRYRIERLRIYLQAVNLFTVTNYSGLDPELPGSNVQFGIDGGGYPNNQKSFNIGVNLSFH